MAAPFYRLRILRLGKGKEPTQGFSQFHLADHSPFIKVAVTTPPPAFICMGKSQTEGSEGKVI